MRPSPPPPAVALAPLAGHRLRTGTLFKARTVPLLSPQHAKQVLFRSVEQPLPFLFLLILGTKAPESLPAEVKGIRTSVCTWGFLKRPLLVTHASPSIHKISKCLFVWELPSYSQETDFVPLTFYPLLCFQISTSYLNSYITHLPSRVVEEKYKLEKAQ